MRFAAIYGNGAAMAFSPQEVRAMSMFQFFAAVDGWMKANVPEEENALSERERDDLWEFISR
ncbi:hypothetical protein [Agrobacterium vitis]|uniref:hypothetical protein n=1 Tax=Agrobacterium vitis TaxID=373 RepID=UPI001572AC2D|nr:hypothetical protein [Agrobacterium vitis]NSZ16602.1 hypothetical protein [Agrobacterium vitis]UJL86451.1 hypothetical protein AVF2S5_05915 [Agrobacterium vitis]BCH59777.1 hypothetical protein RvVAR0630_24010 [Agrobacterium vitis]